MSCATGSLAKSCINLGLAAERESLMLSKYSTKASRYDLVEARSGVVRRVTSLK